MFNSRLNPTKPPASHRAVLERVGAACRELRPKEDECADRSCRNDQIVSILARHGVFRVGIAEEFGGVGADPLLIALTAERLGREGFGPSSVFAAHGAQAAACIAQWGSKDQKDTYLPSAAAGQRLFGSAQNQGTGGSQNTTCTVSFSQTASGFVLNGEGVLAVNVERGGVLILSALNAGGSPSVFLVDCNTPGLSADVVPDQARVPSGGLVDVTLRNCEVPEANLLGTLDAGDQVAFGLRLNGRFASAAASVGMLADCLESMSAVAAEFLSRNPAAVGQKSLEHLVAETAVNLEAVRALVYAAAELKVDYDRRPYWRHLQLETSTLVSEAKMLADRAVERMLNEAKNIILDPRSVPGLVPVRHQRLPRPTIMPTESVEDIATNIADYYLFQ